MPKSSINKAVSAFQKSQARESAALRKGIDGRTSTKKKAKKSPARKKSRGKR